MRPSLPVRRRHPLPHRRLGHGRLDVQQYFVGTYGRLRTVEPSIDGNLWLTTSTGGDKASVLNNSNERIFTVALGG